MPLIKGKSEKSFKENVRHEYKEGKPLKQSLAIAYSMKRKAQKRAGGGSMHGSGCTCPSCRKSYSSGGDVESKPMPSPSPHPLQLPDQAEQEKKQKSLREAFNYAEGGRVAEMKSGFVDHEGNTRRPNGPAMSEEEKKFNQHYPDMQASTSLSEEEDVDSMMDKESQNFSQQDRYAMGGDVAGTVGKEIYKDDEQDLVDRIMRKRKGLMNDFSEEDRYSEGGKVANQDHGPNENDLAGFDTNAFDDLVLRDDLESTYGDDDNAGDSLGNKQEDEDRNDIVARIMRSRAKKDKLPRPA